MPCGHLAQANKPTRSTDIAQEYISGASCLHGMNFFHQFGRLARQSVPRQPDDLVVGYHPQAPASYLICVCKCLIEAVLLAPAAASGFDDNKRMRQVGAKQAL